MAITSPAQLGSLTMKYNAVNSETNNPLDTPKAKTGPRRKMYAAKAPVPSSTASTDAQIKAEVQ